LVAGGELDERVGVFLNRPIEGDWPYLWIDATYVKAREAGSIVSVAVLVAVAVNTLGQRQVIGMKVGPSEAETFWTEFLRSLMRRVVCSLQESPAAAPSWCC
jgi:putative transposase